MSTSSLATIPAAELDALLHLRLLPGLGDIRLTELLEEHGSARAALDAGPAALGGPAAAVQESPRILERLRRTRALLDGGGIHIFVRGQLDYPPVLEQLHDPPMLLFAVGDRSLLERPGIALVGARRCTAYGADVARMLGRDLAAAGTAVISGLARGIDAAAHEGAVPSTIAVLGSGIDVPYPRTNTPLYERIAAEGLLLSEFMPGEPALRHNFPRRNRVIAALARAVVVVEAAAGSGSLITVGHAIDLGRDVLAVPGPLGRATSEAANALLRDGAGVVLGAEDVLDALGLPRPSPPEPPPLAPASTTPDPPRDALLAALSEQPAHVDALARACGLDPGVALPALLVLELRGVARQLPGLRFARVLPIEARTAARVRTPLHAAGPGGRTRNRPRGQGYHRS